MLPSAACATAHVSNSGQSLRTWIVRFDFGSNSKKPPFESAAIAISVPVPGSRAIRHPSHAFPRSAMPRSSTMNLLMPEYSGEAKRIHHGDTETRRRWREILLQTNTTEEESLRDG